MVTGATVFNLLVLDPIRTLAWGSRRLAVSQSYPVRMFSTFTKSESPLVSEPGDAGCVQSTAPSAGAPPGKQGSPLQVDVCSADSSILTSSVCSYKFVIK